MKIKIGKRTVLINFSLSILDTPSEWTYGKSSRIFGYHHALFFDYDRIEERVMVDEQKALMQDFKYGNVYVFELDRSNAFHCVCIDYFILHEVKEIVMSSSCDLAFVNAPRYDRFRNWILRDGSKGTRVPPKFKYVIPSPYEGVRKQNLALAQFLERLYGVKIELKNSDGRNLESNRFPIEYYNTANRVEKEGE
jgi:hypothetical protein